MEKRWWAEDKQISEEDLKQLMEGQKASLIQMGFVCITVLLLFGGVIGWCLFKEATESRQRAENRLKLAQNFQLRYSKEADHYRKMYEATHQENKVLYKVLREMEYNIKDVEE